MRTFGGGPDGLFEGVWDHGDDGGWEDLRFPRGTWRVSESGSGRLERGLPLTNEVPGVKIEERRGST